MEEAHTAVRPVVSVLVAAYNAERWVERAIFSLTRQTLRDIEVIIIDDCSTDGTLPLVRSLSARDGRIKVIARTENGGIAKARNSGLAVAMGRYICMLDADDELEPDALALAVAAFKEDIGCVLLRCDYLYPDGRRETFAMPYKSGDTITGQEAFRLSLDWTIHGLYLVRSDIHRRYPYDEQTRYYSDENTTRLHYLASKRVGFCQGGYLYYQHPESATHADSPHRLDTLEAHASLRRQILAAEQDEAARIYEPYRWLRIIDAYWYYHLHRRTLDRKAALERINTAWRTIDRSALPAKLKRKFGYAPMPAFRLFHLQEWSYFTLRDILNH